jgi:5S rRNA maturation endonuclease (ribonuclease M5)
MFNEGDVERVLERLQIEGIRHGDNITASCPMHMFMKGVEDGNPSWGIHVRTGAHNCFSCGYKGNLLSLVADYLDLGGLDEAKTWLYQNLEVDWEDVSKQLEEARQTYYTVPRLVSMSEGRLGVFEDVPEWAARDKAVTVEACNYFGVRWRPTDSTWIIPIRSENGALLGWQEKGHLTRKFFNRPPRVTKSKTLFGLHKWTEGMMIIVESPLDVVHMYSLGISGGVASYGAIVSTDQIKLLRKSDRIILALDNDDTGKTASDALSHQLRKEGIEFWTFNYGDKNVKDIGEMDRVGILEGLTNSTHCVLNSHTLTKSQMRRIHIEKGYKL